MEKVLMILENLYNKKIITDYRIKRANKIIDYSFKCSSDTIDQDCNFEDVENIQETIELYIKNFDNWCENIVA